ncbi:MAG: hypothetical protein K0B02_05415 [DPANN group archaeon]|nr:hypothetical protein [DPANN group archaeon]
MRKEAGKSLGEWFKIQIEFLKNHKYYTKSAQVFYNRQKAENLKNLITPSIFN